jgi:hypothetical protein
MPPHPSTQEFVVISQAWPTATAHRSTTSLHSVPQLCLSALLVWSVIVDGGHAVAMDINFERDIRPLLIDRCSDCHGSDLQEARLRLDVRHRAIKGSEFGPVITAGNAATSPLMQRVMHTDDTQRMPPDGPLPASEIALLKQWIDQGAVWPESDTDRQAREAEHDPRLEHWAWQPVVRPALPAATPTSRSAHPIDLFLAASLHDAGLEQAPEADRRTLIRRLSFDLLGLPPHPVAVAAFEEDTRPDAYEQLLNELLASPHYGERQARHWLDIAHYADTHGFERDQIRETAWRYRDWLINAFNDDLPYDAFLRRQIAGDVIAPDDPQFTIATGFLAAGPWDFVGQVETKSGVLRRQARADDLDDLITQVMTAACGVTINCARCHDHKLDPISQREYYAITAIFSGVTRGERSASPAADAHHAAEKKRLATAVAETRATIGRLTGRGLDLADIVGGGDGYATGTAGAGLHPLTGTLLEASPMGFLEGVTPNTPVAVAHPLIAAVFVPTGPGPVPVTTDGLTVPGIAATSSAAWDAIRHGPVNSQHATTLDGVDYATDGHTLLGLHANAGITFDLTAIRATTAMSDPVFRCIVGYGGKTPVDGADYTIAVDGRVTASGRLGRDDGGVSLEIPLAPESRYLTLISTDAGNGISHDQIFFADARIEGTPADATAEDRAALAIAQQRLHELEQQRRAIAPPATFYGPVPQEPATIHRLTRGNPETPAESVAPAALECLSGVSSNIVSGDASDAQRRLAFANWVTSPSHPLTARVIVNRLWQSHFGKGLVDTPSDFGLGGSRPSHPELLDWLAAELVAHDWSLKHLHRLICTSAAYRQQSHGVLLTEKARRHDADNRLLWRQNPRRVDAESLRDATLAVSGCLNTEMFGPGYRDFDYEEAYAPVYTYLTADAPELWRRTIYRFIVRSTPSQLLTTLDCPNPANLTPVRLETTTPLQSLALLNNDFLLRQAEHFATRLANEADTPEDQVRRGFALAFQRQPDPVERNAAVALLSEAGLTQFCRMLLNANEFVTID